MSQHRRNELVPEVNDGVSKPCAAPHAADAVSRVNQFARRDPAALLGVLEFWLAPQSLESESRADS